MTFDGPTPSARLTTRFNRYGSSRIRTTSSVVRARRKAPAQRRSARSRTTNDEMTGAATNTADECACTASTANAVAASPHHIDARPPSSSTIAIAAFTNATATGGFQIVALIARSIGDVATSSVTAIARLADAVFRQIAMSSSASAADCRIAMPMPPACGRFSVHGPTRCRMTQTVQTNDGPSVAPPAELGPTSGRSRQGPSAIVQYRTWSPSRTNVSVMCRVRANIR